MSGIGTHKLFFLLSFVDNNGLAEVYFMFGDLSNYQYVLAYSGMYLAIMAAKNYAGDKNVEVNSLATHNEMKLALQDQEAKAVFIISHGAGGGISWTDWEQENLEPFGNYLLQADFQDISSSIEYIDLVVCETSQGKWEEFAKMANEDVEVKTVKGVERIIFSTLKAGIRGSNKMKEIYNIQDQKSSSPEPKNPSSIQHPQR